MKQDYKDPKDLRGIPIERLKYEGNQLGKQFNEWNDFFNIESAIRVWNRKVETREIAAYDGISEVEKWSILSNRYLLMEREHLTDHKLFNLEEVKKMMREAYNQGWQDCQYKDEEKINQWEGEERYINTSTHLKQ